MSYMFLCFFLCHFDPAPHKEVRVLTVMTGSMVTSKIIIIISLAEIFSQQITQKLYHLSQSGPSSFIDIFPTRDTGSRFNLSHVQ